MIKLTRTYTEQAVRLSRTFITDDRLAKWKATDLKEAAETFSRALQESGDECRANVVSAHSDDTRADLARILKREAAYVNEVEQEESSARWTFSQRNGFYAKLVAMRDSSKEASLKEAQELHGIDGWHWASDVSDYINKRAMFEVLTKVVASIEGLCAHMSIGQASEHALYSLTSEVLLSAEFGTSRSTSQVHNAVEAALTSAKAQVLREGSFSEITPTAHLDLIPNGV